MKAMLARAAVIVVILLCAAWLSIDSFSDELVGNHRMQAEDPQCEDPTWCETVRDLFIADAHSDTLLHRRLDRKSGAGHVDLDRLVEGGVDLQVFAVASVAPKLVTRQGARCGSLRDGDRLTTYFVLKEPLRPATWVSPMARVDRMIARFDAAFVRDAEGAKLTRVATRADLEALAGGGQQGQAKVGAVLAIEGAYWASGDKAELIRQLDKLEAAGVRMIGLTHRSSNHLAGSNEDCADRHGLTGLGSLAVVEIWKRGMILDLAHASSATIADVARMASEGTGGGVVVSHTGIRSACKHNRNLSDEDLRNVVRAGGVVALGFWTTVNCIHGSSTAASAREAIARTFAIAHQVLNAPEFVAEMGAGYDPTRHIALGSDFDGATLVPAGASAVPWYLEGIAEARIEGRTVFNRTAVENIAGRNLFRLLMHALPTE